MELVDLSREIHHRTQVHPTHPPVIITAWSDHSEKKHAGSTEFSSKALSIAFSDHAGTHVDAPAHFDPRPGAASIDEMPLEAFYTSAFCIDLSHLPLRSAATVDELKAAVEKAGEQIRPRDTVLIHMGTNDRLLGKPGYLHDFPGLSVEGVHWLADSGVGMFGVEAVSPSPEGELNFKAHLACADRNITHMECLANLDKLLGRGRFRFIGFPLRIRGGTASPIRAVALFE
jgi:kynurenine formamidase